MSENGTVELSLSHWGLFKVNLPIILIEAGLSHLLQRGPGQVIPVKRMDITQVMVALPS
jgi:hypothetical protein